MNEMLRLERFFMGEPDRCERLISGLHYCMCLGPEGDLQQEEQLYLMLEKGLLYRGMFYNFSELKLVDQLQTVLEKFTEFDEIFVPQTQIEMYRLKPSMLEKAIDVIMTIAASLPGGSRAPACFLLLELGDDLILLRVVNNAPFDALLLSSNVSYCYVNGEEGLYDLLQPSVQRLLATDATANAGARRDDDIKSEDEHGMVVVNLLILLNGSPESIAGLEETGASIALEEKLQEIRKAEKVHTLTTLRSRISLIEKYESGHDGVSSMEPSRSVPQVSMEPTLSVSSPTSRHSPLHISFNGNRRPECDDDEGVVTTRSLVGGSVDEQNCFRMSMGEGAKEAEKEFGVSRVVSGSRMSPISIQPDDDTSTNNVRESLLHEIMDSRGSEDCVEFGQRAYMAIRENAFAHKEDWEGNEKGDMEVEGELPAGNDDLNVSQRSHHSNLSLSNEFDIVSEMNAHVKPAESLDDLHIPDSSNPMLESLDIDTKMKNYINKIAALRESLCEDDDDEESHMGISRELGGGTGDVLNQTLPLPPAASATDSLSMSRTLKTVHSDSAQILPPPTLSMLSSGEKLLPPINRSFDDVHKSNSENNSIKSTTEDDVNEDPSLLEYEAAARKFFDDSSADIVEQKAVVTAEVEDEKGLKVGRDDVQTRNCPLPETESKVVDLCGVNSLGDRAISLHSSNSSARFMREYHSQYSLEDMEHPENAPARPTFPIPDSPTGSSGQSKGSSSSDDSINSDEGSGNVEFPSSSSSYPSSPVTRQYGEVPGSQSALNLLRDKNIPSKKTDNGVIIIPESTNPFHTKRNHDQVTDADEATATASIQDTIRRLMSIEKQKIDEDWHQKQEKRSLLRAKKGREIFLHLQATATARAKFRRGEQKDTKHIQVIEEIAPIHSQRQENHIHDHSQHFSNVEHRDCSEPKHDVEADWMLNCDKVDTPLSPQIQYQPSASSQKASLRGTVRTGPPTVSQLRAMESEEVTVQSDAETTINRKVNPVDHHLYAKSHEINVSARGKSNVISDTLSFQEPNISEGEVDDPSPPVPPRSGRSNLPLPVASKTTSLSERERLIRERGVQHAKEKWNSQHLHEEGGHHRPDNEDSELRNVSGRKKWASNRNVSGQGDDQVEEDNYHIHVPSVDDTVTVDTTGHGSYHDFNQQHHLHGTNDQRARSGRNNEHQHHPSGGQRGRDAAGSDIAHASSISSRNKSTKKPVMSLVTTPQDDANDEKRRLAKFEQMRKKKLEEAAVAKQQKELQLAQRGGYGGGYAAREAERQRLASLESNKKNNRGKSGRTIDDDDARTQASNGSSFNAKENTPRGNRMRGGDLQRPVREAPPPRGPQVNENDIHEDTYDSGEGGGYLRQHEEESAHDRKIRLLEEEVASMTSPSPAPQASHGRDDNAHRSHSANPTYRRPSARSQRDNAPNPSHQSKGSISVRSEGSRSRGATQRTTPRAASAGRAGAGKRGRLNNAQQIRNALNMVCLAGSAHDTTREEALSAIEESLANGNMEDGAVGPLQFLIVMHQSKMLSFKGLYLVDSYTGDICKLTGRGPKQLSLNLITEYFKYESSSRSFRKLPTITLTSICDAVSIDPTKLKKSGSSATNKSKLY